MKKTKQETKYSALKKKIDALKKNKSWQEIATLLKIPKSTVRYHGDKKRKKQIMWANAQRTKDLRASKKEAKAKIDTMIGEAMALRQEFGRVYGE